MRSIKEAGMLGFTVVALVVGGCGGDGGAPTQGADADGLEEAVTEYTEAFIQGDAGTVYEYFTEDCKEQLSEEEFEDQFDDVVGLVEGFSGKDLEDAEVGDVETRDVSETEGEARVELVDEDGDPFFDEEEATYDEYVYEDGGWRTEGCDEFDLEGSFDTGFSDFDTSFQTDFDTTGSTDDTGDTDDTDDTDDTGTESS